MMSKDIEYQILSLIENSDTPLGSNALSAMLKNKGINASAPTIGRILSVLETQGYLTLIGKKGRILSESGKNTLSRMHLKEELENAASDLVNILTRSDSNDIRKLIDLMTARKVLEKEASYLAALNATDSELNTIATYAGILDSVMKESHTKTGLHHVADMGRLFHETIAKASRNEILYAIIHLINQDIAARDYLFRLLEKANYSFNTGHMKILNAMKRRNPDEAAAAAAEHLDVVVNALLRLEAKYTAKNYQQADSGI